MPLSENSLRGRLWKHLQSCASFAECHPLPSGGSCCGSKKKDQLNEKLLCCEFSLRLPETRRAFWIKVGTRNANRNYCNWEKLFLCRALFLYSFFGFVKTFEASKESTNQNENVKSEKREFYMHHMCPTTRIKKVLQCREQIVDKQWKQHWRLKATTKSTCLLQKYVNKRTIWSSTTWKKLKCVKLYLSYVEMIFLGFGIKCFSLTIYEWSTECRTIERGSVHYLPATFDFVQNNPLSCQHLSKMSAKRSPSSSSAETSVLLHANAGVAEKPGNKKFNDDKTRFSCPFQGVILNKMRNIFFF